MLGNKHGLPLALQKRNRLREIAHRGHIERRGWLIEHEDVGMHRIDRRKNDRLLPPAGKRLGAAAEQALDTKRCRCLRHTFDHFLAIDSEVLASEGDFRGHVEIDELATRHARKARPSSMRKRVFPQQAPHLEGPLRT